MSLTLDRLFGPFQLSRWVALGFVAFLDQCGRTGGGGGPGGPGGPGGGGGEGGQATRAFEWMGAHVLFVTAIAAAVLLLIVSLLVLVTWLNSRGVFMYLDDVATGRADVARPWRENARHASSYFVWILGLHLFTLLGVLILLVPGVLSGMALVRQGGAALPVIGLLSTVLALLVLVVAVSIAGVLLRDFVAPLQWGLNVPCGEAVRRLRGLLAAHTGVFIVFLLLKVVYSLMSSMVILTVGCCTCCLGFLPVVSQTLFQPIFYFERAWSLELLRQMGVPLEVPAAIEA